jgi:diguanylate cyclase (GGDEF)-like protein/PAS domain S-box-containing protein
MDARRQSASHGADRPIEPTPPASVPAEPGDLFRNAFEEAPVAIALAATDGHLLAVNRALCELVGRSPKQLLGGTLQDVTHPDDVLATVRAARRMITGDRTSYEAEKRYLRPDGSVVWGLLRTSLVRDAHGDPSHFVSHITDISERKLAEGEASPAGRPHDATVRDPLTGARNHRDFREALEIEIERAARYDRELSLAVFDVDEFARLNTERGHAHGDAVLRSIAAVIEEVSRRPDLAARIGGDEFALILPETDAPGAARAARRVVERVWERYDLEVGISVGVATLAPDHAGADELLWEAERAAVAARC